MIFQSFITIQLLTSSCLSYHLQSLRETRHAEDYTDDTSADIELIIVDNPPNGVNFSGCVINKLTGDCCIDLVRILELLLQVLTNFYDKVEEIESAVLNPMLECITQYEEICHTSYVTNYVPTVEQDCENEFEKKCKIVIQEVTHNETIKNCVKPLERVCDEEGDRVKRDDQSFLESVETFGPSLPNAQRDSSCKTYFETVCTPKNKTEREEEECQSIPVRLCADGCRIEEGAPDCSELQVVVTREEPREFCELVPHQNCRYKSI